MQRWSAAGMLALSVASACTAAAAETNALTPFFYRDREYGSDGQFNPISSFINWSFDSLQVPQSFGVEDWGRQRSEVSRNLRHPREAIERAGGRRAFVNRQIFPIDSSTKDWIPNYSLHLLGGGMVYRKNAEWFAARGYGYPRLYAATLGMAAEYLQEVVEKKSTGPDDEVADFYLFRPAGILLFEWEPFARFAAETLRLAEWPYQPMVNLSTGKFANVGENFIARPALFGRDAISPFVYFGITTLLGASHPTGAGESIAWGIGAAVERADPLELRPSAGVFYDRNDSLLASLLVNTTDGLALRLNIHPGVIAPRAWWSPGVFVGFGRSGELSVGLTVRLLPLGIAAGR